MRRWLYFLLSASFVVISVAIMPKDFASPVAAIFAYLGGWAAARCDS